MEHTFSGKWANIRSRKVGADECSLFISPGEVPRTQRQVIFWNEFLLFRDILKKNNARDVLEVGCGRGTMSLYLAEHLGLSVSLLDNATDALEVAKEEFKRRGKSASFHVADALVTGLPASSYDAVISVGLAEHMEDVNALYREQFRLLRPGGVMISLNIPKKFSIQFLNIWWRVVLKIFGKYKGSVKKDYYRNTLSAADYKKAAEGAGFHAVDFVYACPFPIFTPLSVTADRILAQIYNSLLFFRRMFLREPFVTNAVLAQEHIIIAYRPSAT